MQTRCLLATLAGISTSLQKPNRELTARERRFVSAYLLTANGKEAAEQAGYSTNGAKVTACRLLKLPHIQAALQRRRGHVEANLDNPGDIEAARLLTELSVIAFSDVRDLFDERGKLRPIHELPEGPARALASIEVSRVEHGDDPPETIVKVKQWDKLRAIELIGKLRGLFPSEKHLHGHVHMTLEQLVAGHAGD